MKKLLIFLFVLVSFASFGQNTNAFTGIIIKNSHTSDSSGINKIWYNAATAKFRFWDGTGKHTFGSGTGSFALTNGQGTTANSTAVDLGGTISSLRTINFGTNGLVVESSASGGATTSYFSVANQSSIPSVNLFTNNGAFGALTYLSSIVLNSSSSNSLVRLRAYNSGGTAAQQFILTDAGIQMDVSGGNDTRGDMYFRNSSSLLGRLADVATGNAIISGGVAGDPAYGKIGLTTHVSGILPVANGGTATATPALVAGTNITITGTWPNQTINSSAGGGSNPFDDGTALVKGSADATKLLRFEVDGFTTGVTRVLTPPNFDGIIATTNNAQTITAVQTFSSAPVVPTGAPLSANTNAANQLYVDNAVAAQAMAAFSTTVPGYVNTSTTGKILLPNNTWGLWTAFANGTTPTGSDAIAGVQGGANVYWTLSQFAGYSTIDNAGSPITQRSVLNVVNGLTAVDNNPNTDLKLGGALTANTNLTGAFRLGIGTTGDQAFLINGATTYTASLQSHFRWNSAITGSATTSDVVYGGLWDFGVTAGANSQGIYLLSLSGTHNVNSKTGVKLTDILINPTLTGSFSNHYAIGIGSGFVGIGTITPTVDLHVMSSVTGFVAHQLFENTSTTGYALTQFKNNSANTWYQFLSGSAVATSGLTTSNQACFFFSTGVASVLFRNDQTTDYIWSIGGFAAGNEVFRLKNQGVSSFTQAAMSSAWAPAMTFNLGAHTAMTANTAFPNIIVPVVTQTWVDGTVADQPSVWIKAPTYNGTTTLATFTTGSNLKVDAPIAGAKGAITNNFAIWSNGGLKVSGQTLLGTGTTAASTAPLKFTSGSLNTTAEAGAVEFLTDSYYATITTGAARKEIVLSDATLTSGRFVTTTTNGRVASPNAFTVSGTVASIAQIVLAAQIATSAGSAPFKFTSSAGVVLATPETGAVEYDGTNLFFTRSGTTREGVITESAVNSVSPTAPNRTITINIGGTTYYLAAKTTND